MNEFYVEHSGSGLRTPLPDQTEDTILDFARRLYPEDSEDPVEWVVWNQHDGSEEYFLVPGGPGGEEFTWMPRSMWQAGGPVASVMDDL